MNDSVMASNFGIWEFCNFSHLFMLQYTFLMSVLFRLKKVPLWGCLVVFGLATLCLIVFICMHIQVYYTTLTVLGQINVLGLSGLSV